MYKKSDEKQNNLFLFDHSVYIVFASTRTKKAAPDILERTH